MTHAQASEEVEFLRGMEREEIVTTTVDAAKETWTLDAIRHKLAESVREFMAEMREQVRTFAQSRHDGPDPDDNYADMHGRLVDLERQLDRQRYAAPPSYNNGDGGSSSAWQKWMLTLCGALAILGIGGGVAVYGKMSALEANQNTQTAQIARLQNQLDTMIQQLRRP